jgi:hypothetical protein
MPEAHAPDSGESATATVVVRCRSPLTSNVATTNCGHFDAESPQRSEAQGRPSRSGATPGRGVPSSSSFPLASTQRDPSNRCLVPHAIGVLSSPSIGSGTFCLTSRRRGHRRLYHRRPNHMHAPGCLESPTPKVPSSNGNHGASLLVVRRGFRSCAPYPTNARLGGA